MANISSIKLPDGTTYDIKDSNSGYITGMTILSYGSSTWQNFIDAYDANKIVYCRASSNSNPASGSQTRLAFMAYVNNATTPTNVEFQYYRSVSSHTESQQGDQVFVYKLDKTSGWSVTTREASVKVVAGDGLGGTYSNGTMTLTGPTKVSDLTNDSGFSIDYIAVYGETTFAEIYDAYSNGQSVICLYTPSDDVTMWLPLAFSDSETFMFAQFNDDREIVFTSIDSLDVWVVDVSEYATNDTATILMNGLMSSSDKIKLNGIASGAEVNVQSDWNQSTSTADDYIKNKPTIPAKTSDLTNDSGFVAVDTITVTLTTAGWSSDAQTVTATGVTSSNTVIVSPVPSAMSDYVDGGIVCTAQGTNTLTFECDTTPSSAIVVNVVII